MGRPLAVHNQTMHVYYVQQLLCAQTVTPAAPYGNQMMMYKGVLSKPSTAALDSAARATSNSGGDATDHDDNGGATLHPPPTYLLRCWQPTGSARKNGVISHVSSLTVVSSRLARYTELPLTICILAATPRLS